MKIGVPESAAGPGAGSFSFDIAEKALRQGVTSGTISSHVHQTNYNGPVFDLATTLSKFLLLGMTLEDVIARATSNAAAMFASRSASEHCVWARWPTWRSSR